MKFNYNQDMQHSLINMYALGVCLVSIFIPEVWYRNRILVFVLNFSLQFKTGHSVTTSCGNSKQQVRTNLEISLETVHYKLTTLLLQTVNAHSIISLWRYNVIAVPFTSRLSARGIFGNTATEGVSYHPLPKFSL